MYLYVTVLSAIYCLFFFSSRRRHTRLVSDWSSDVCSSDLDFREHWERLRFRDYLRAHPEVAREYGELKLRLASQHGDDRIAYTRGKSEFIKRVMEKALASK